MQNLIYGCLFFPLCHLEEEKKQYSKIHSNTRPDPYLHPCRNHVSVVITGTGRKESTGFSSLLDRVLLCKWPALQSLQDTERKAVSSPGVTNSLTPLAWKWKVYQSVFGLFYQKILLKIKPSHGALNDDSFNTPNATCKKRTTKQDKKVFFGC